MTEPGRCRTCRFWDPDGPGTLDGWGTCRLAATDTEGEPADARRLAAALAAPSGFGAVLLTAPAFGCGQWAERDERPAPDRRP